MSSSSLKSFSPENCCFAVPAMPSSESEACFVAMCFQHCRLGSNLRFGFLVRSLDAIFGLMLSLVGLPCFLTVFVVVVCARSLAPFFDICFVPLFCALQRNGNLSFQRRPQQMGIIHNERLTL